MITICHSVTGRILFGPVDLRPQPGTKPANLVDAGHTLVESAPPAREHKWNGAAWVEDSELVADKAARDKANAIARTDIDMARIAEDLVDLLVSKGVMSMTELPPATVRKLAARKALR